MPDLYEIATSFRSAIEKTVREGKIQEMRNFPCGCCTYASDLLQRYLIEKYEIFTWCISGVYDYGEAGESHTWLETYDHSLVIDITGEQYKNKKPRFTESVYVGPRTDGFHDKFEIEGKSKYIRYDGPFDENRKADKRYKEVLSNL